MTPSWASIPPPGVLVLLALLLAPLLVAIYFVPTAVRRLIVIRLGEWADRAPEPRPYEEHVVPHGPLVQHYNNLWTLTGPVPSRLFRLPRTMLLYRIPGSSALLVHSPICVHEDVVRQIEGLGEIRYILVPNQSHLRDYRPWARRYPNATVLTPSFTMKYVAGSVAAPVRACEDAISEFCADRARDLMPGLYYMPIGYEKFEFAYVLRLECARDPEAVAVVVCDTFFNLQTADVPVAIRAMGCAGGFRVSKFGVIVSRDLKSLLEWILDLAYDAVKMKVKGVFMAHGDPVVGPDNVVSALKVAADRLTRDMSLYY